MIRFLLVISLVTFSLAITADAQTNAKNRPKPEQTRFQKQHMVQTLSMHVDLLKDSDPLKRATGVQNIRYLEYAYPDEPFTNILSPLMERLKDENETTQVRMLSAIALDGLHNDTGDKAIEEMSKMSNNKNLKELCIALLVKD
jgi:hypothetical protein